MTEMVTIVAVVWLLVVVAALADAPSWRRWAALGVMAPATLRNARVFHQFVLANTNAGYAYFWANHPIHGADFKDVLGADDPAYHDLIPPELRGIRWPFMVAGLWLTRRDWRRTMPLLLFAAVYTVVHLASWALVRYHPPVDAVLLVFAAVALQRLLDRLRRQPALPRAAATTPGPA